MKSNSPVKQQPAVVKTIGGLFAFQMPESGITLIAKILSIVMLSIFGGSSEKKRGFSLSYGGCKTLWVLCA